MKSKMNKSKKRMKNKKGRNGNQTVKMRGGKSLKEYIRGDKNKRREQSKERAKQIKQALGKAKKYVFDKTGQAVDKAVGKATEVASNATKYVEKTSDAVDKAFTATSYKKQFDKKVLDHISGKKNIIKSVESLKETVFNLHSKIEKAYKQLDIFKNADSKGKTIEEFLNTAMKEALNKQYTAEKYADELKKSGDLAQKAVSAAEEAVSNETNNFKNTKEENTQYTQYPFNKAIIKALNVLTNAQEELTKAQEELTKAQTESAETAANEFLNNVSLNEVTALYNIIEKNKNEGIDKDNPSELTSIFENYKENMYQLIYVKKEMYNKIFKYNQIFKYKKNYTNQEYEIFFNKIIDKIDFTQYDNLVKLYDDIVNELKNIYSSDNNLLLSGLVNEINNYNFSSLEHLVPAEATPITREPTRGKKDKNKITDIDIKFYKSNFKNKNPFPYYEQVVLNRTGIDVISDLYGVEELFPTFKEELQYLADPKKFIEDPENEYKFKPFKRKHIKIEHTKNDKSAPSLDFFE